MISVPAFFLNKWLSVGVGAIVALVVDPTVFAASVVTIIVAITGAVVAIIQALSKAKQELMTTQNDLLAKADVIQRQNDGMMRAATDHRTASDEKIASLLLQLAEKDRDKALLAQAKSTADAVAASQTPISIHAAAPSPALVSSVSSSAADSTAESLGNIDKHTEAIEKNTADLKHKQ